MCLLRVPHPCESVNREARGPQAAGGNKLQVADILPPFSVEDTWFCLNWTFFKLWDNQCVFLTEVFFLSYVNETMCLLWNVPFFKSIRLRRTFFFSFLFSDLGLIMVQQTNIHVNCFMAGDDTPSSILSQKCILWERGLVKLPQPWGVSLVWLTAC